MKLYARDTHDILDEAVSMHMKVGKHLNRLTEELKHAFKVNYIVSLMLQFKEEIMCAVRNDKCPMGEKNARECKGKLQEYLDRLIASLDDEEIESSLQIMREIHEYSVMKSETIPVPGCKRKWIKITRLVERQMESLIEFQYSFMPSDLELPQYYKVSADYIYKAFLLPLSHQARVQILLEISNGNTRFNMLEKAINYKSGHLVYHINKLAEAGLIEKAAGKEYTLTSKGKVILSMLSLLQKRFPETPSGSSTEFKRFN